MKRGCLVTLIFWAIFSGAYWYFLHSRFRAPLDWLVPLIAGLFMAGVVDNLRNSIASAVDAVRLSSQPSFSGITGEKPKDGALVSVTGHIRVIGPELRTPFSDRPAALYRYAIDDDALGGTDDARKDFTG